LRKAARLVDGTNLHEGKCGILMCMTDSARPLEKQSKAALEKSSAVRGETPFIVLLCIALSCAAQNPRPDFTGVWRSANSAIEVEQTTSTISLRPVSPNFTAPWSVFPIEGAVLKTKTGRHLIERTGHWTANRLILLETAPGNAPWRRSTEERTLSLDAGRLTIHVHNLSDKRHQHDHNVELEPTQP
jgi:hypothetical protein